MPAQYDGGCTGYAGVHPKVVQEDLGHSTIGVTLNTYSHVSVGMRRDAAEKVAGLIFGP
jgi:integrase